MLKMKKRLCIVFLVLLLAVTGVCPAFADDESASDLASNFEMFLMLSGKKCTRLEKGQVIFSTMDFDTEVVQVDHVTEDNVQIPIEYQFFDFAGGNTTLHFAVVKAALPGSAFGMTDENVMYCLFGNDYLNRYANLGRFYLTQDESGKWYVEMRYDLMLEPGSAGKVCYGVLNLLEKDIDEAVKDLKDLLSSYQ